jgi:hypothetical protein
VSSTFKEQLNSVFMDWFGWLDRETAALMFVSVAVLMVMLGLAFAIVRPRGVGAMLIVVHGLLWIAPVAVWYDALPRLHNGFWVVFAWIMLQSAFNANLCFWAARKPTAKECGITRPLMLVGGTYACFTLSFVLEAYYVLSLNPITGPADAWYILKFVRVDIIVFGALLAIAGTITVAVNRIIAKPPYRPI